MYSNPMNSKKTYSLNNTKPFINKAFHNNGSSKLLDLSSIVSNIGEPSEKHFMFRLQEMEEINAHLEKLVEQRTKKLTEVIAANTKFISIISHDLRSPFSSILYALDIIKQSLNDKNSNEIEKYIDMASNCANGTLNLLDDLLEWTISQNEGSRFNPVKINLNQMVTDEIENIRASAIQKQITLNHSIIPDLNVTADIQMVKTIIRNLISNAIKYTSTGGEIMISATESKKFVEIVVKDNGIGISPEAQRALYKIKAFHSTTGTNNEKGTGLGLILCREFVEMHGGNIRIESEPGKGSKFKFTLPHYI
jgi:signal transduction histidine kinase